jgi:N-acetylmuramoyl-L-alanine amidase
MLSRHAIPLLLAAVLCWIGLSPVASAQWEVKQISGRDYVNVDGLKTFYSFNTIRRSGNQIILDKIDPKDKRKGVLMKLSVGSQECLMNGMKFVFSYKVEEHGGRAWISRIDLSKLIDPVLRPNYIANAGDFRTVIIDPGHGGKDPGATNALGTEAFYNLDVSQRLKYMLTKLGYKVLMTRDTNRYLTLQERVDFANRVTENAIFISIHHNSGGSSARGLETFTLSPIGVAHYGRGLNSSDFQMRTGNGHDSANVALATAVHGTILRVLTPEDKPCYTLDRGIKRARFSVLTGVKHPSILVECGFLSHPYEARLVHTESYRNTMATGITKAVMKYRGAVTKKPAAKP